MHGFQAKKFNCGKLVEQGFAIRYTGKIAEYLAGLSDSESVSRAWQSSLIVRVSVEPGRTSGM
jgi:hypothetical protein